MKGESAIYITGIFFIIYEGISDQKAQKLKDIIKQNQLVSVGFTSVIYNLYY